MIPTEYSKHTAEFTIEVPGENGAESVKETYSITLLNVQAVFKLQFILGNQIKFAMGDKGVDPELMWGLAQKLLKFSTVNGYELTEAKFEEHFHNRIEILDKVVLEALKRNLPGFTKQLTALAVQWMTKLSKSAKDASASEILKSATQPKDNQSSL